MSWLFAFFHHCAAFLMVAAVAHQWLALKSEVTEGAIRRLAVVDAIYGLSATLVLIIGFVRVYMYEKGAAYYWSSSPFILKLVIFALVAAISFYPTYTFLKWRRAMAAGKFTLPNGETIERIRFLKSLELVGIVFILLCASLIARGVGMIQ